MPAESKVGEIMTIGQHSWKSWCIK